MPQYPSVVKQFRVFNAAGGQFVGLADIQLPHVQMEKNDIKGSSIMSMNLPIEGMVQPMETTLTFHTQTLQSLALFNGGAAQIRCLSSLQVYDTSAAQFDELPEEIIMTLLSDSSDLGKRESSNKGTVTLKFSCIYLAMYFNSKLYWEVDTFGLSCILNGTQVNAQTLINIGG